jgi:hypothetical protein
LRKTKASISSNDILYVIASNQKLDELPIELKEQKSASGDDVKKGLYIPSSDMIYKYCISRKQYIKDDPACSFDSVRQWGIKVTRRTYPIQFSAKGKVYVFGQTIAWHESHGTLLYIFANHFNY